MKRDERFTAGEALARRRAGRRDLSRNPHRGLTELNARLEAPRHSKSKEF